MDLRVKRAKDMMGERLKRLREEKGLSVSELARVAKKDRTYIHDIEAGRANVTIETYAHLLSYCGLDFDEFLAGFRQEDAPSADQELHRLLSIALNSGVAELRSAAQVMLEALAEKASRMQRVRASPHPSSGESQAGSRMEGKTAGSRRR